MELEIGELDMRKKSLVIGVVAGLLGALLLSGCGSAYVRRGEPCDKVGATARGKNGAYYVCKAPAKSDPSGIPRWRSA